MHKLLRLALAISGATLMLSAVALPIATQGEPARAAVGGPVIIGGDDMTDHGEVDIDGNPLEGWLYMQRALENIEPNVTRSNDGSVAALATSPSAATDEDAGAAIGVAADKAGLTVTYHDDGAGIDAFFADLAADNVSPAIIYIPGDGASNDIETQEEIDALTNNASAINEFVNSGGGLFSNGSEFGWLQALLPGIVTVDVGGGDLYFTAEGLAALPGLTEPDINAGPWHNFFTGDFGGLDVLVRSSSVSTCDINEVSIQAVQECEDAPVILGGSQVSITDEVDDDPTATATSCIPAIPGYRCDGNPGSGAGTAVPLTPTPGTGEPTPAPSTPTSAATPGGGAGGAAGAGGQPGGITGPDTGHGTATTGSDTPMLAMALLGAAGLALAAAGARGFRLKR